jgi:hypothetical protein
MSSTIDHRVPENKPSRPLRQFKLYTARVVVKWVTISEFRVLIVFDFYSRAATTRTEASCPMEHCLDSHWCEKRQTTLSTIGEGPIHRSSKAIASFGSRLRSGIKDCADHHHILGPPSVWSCHISAQIDLSCHVVISLSIVGLAVSVCTTSGRDPVDHLLHAPSSMELCASARDKAVLACRLHRGDTCQHRLLMCLDTYPIGRGHRMPSSRRPGGRVVVHPECSRVKGTFPLCPEGAERSILLVKSQAMANQ